MCEGVVNHVIIREYVKSGRVEDSSHYYLSVKLSKQNRVEDESRFYLSVNLLKQIGIMINHLNTCQ